jgi:antirestriction protein ArdC
MATATKTRSASKAKAKPAATNPPAKPAAQGEPKDIYSRITETIVRQLEVGTRPWHQPWSAGHAAGPVNRPLRPTAIRTDGGSPWSAKPCPGTASWGTPYRGINVIMLWIAAMERGYIAPLWMTYKQAQKLGGQVRKGETSSLVAYADTLSWTRTDDDGEEQTLERWFWKGYAVFNVQQIDGLPAHYYALAGSERLSEAERIARAEAFVAHCNPRIESGSAVAAYRLADDLILMPPFPSFVDAASYYATLLHEMTHWTRHESRLDRDLGRKKWGDAGYAMEELVAEMAAAFLCADLGITPDVREDHAGYIASWLQVLKNDNRAVFTAASHAQRAVDYLWKLQPAADERDEADKDQAPLV